MTKSPGDYAPQFDTEAGNPLTCHTPSIVQVKQAGTYHTTISELGDMSKTQGGRNWKHREGKATLQRPTMRIDGE